MTNFLGQKISFGNRHGQNFCYAKTTSSPCFFGFSNRHNMVKAFLLRSKFTNSLREQLRCRRTFWRFALKTVCDRHVFFGGILCGFLKAQAKLLFCCLEGLFNSKFIINLKIPWLLSRYFIKSFTRFFSKNRGVLGQSPRSYLLYTKKCNKFTYNMLL